MDSFDKLTKCRFSAYREASFRRQPCESIDAYESNNGNFWLFCTNHELCILSQWITKNRFDVLIVLASLPGTICLNCLEYGFTPNSPTGDGFGWCLNHVRDFESMGIYDHGEWTDFRLKELEDDAELQDRIVSNI